MPVNCEPFEPMTFDIDTTCCIAKVLCDGLVKFAFNLSTTTIIDTNGGGYRIQDGVNTPWNIPSSEANSYASDIAALWDAICICRATGTLGEANLDRELVETCYDAVQNGTGYSIGDKITRVMILDVTTDPSTIESSIYINKTTGSAITGVLGDFQVCTGSGTCLDPVYTFDYRYPYCDLQTHTTVWRGIDSCTDGPAFYDEAGNPLVGVDENYVMAGVCPVKTLGIQDGITILNDDTVKTIPPYPANRISFKNDGATDLEISFDGGGTYPLKVYSTSGIISFGSDTSEIQQDSIKCKGSVTSKYLIWWEY